MSWFSWRKLELPGHQLWAHSPRWSEFQSLALHPGKALRCPLTGRGFLNSYGYPWLGFHQLSVATSLLTQSILKRNRTASRKPTARWLSQGMVSRIILGIFPFPVETQEGHCISSQNDLDGNAVGVAFVTITIRPSKCDWQSRGHTLPSISLALRHMIWHNNKNFFSRMVMFKMREKGGDRNCKNLD